MKRSYIYIFLTLLTFGGAYILASTSQTSTTNISSGNLHKNLVHNFELTYPDSWISPANSSHSNPTFDTYQIFSAQDPDRRPTDTGGGFAPVFSIKSLPSPSDIPSHSTYFQAEPEEISSSTKPVQLFTDLATQETFTSFGVEGSSNITYRVQLSNNNKLYLLELGYTLAGCNLLPEAFRQECTSNNQVNTNKADLAWNQIISSFRFR